ncbi:MAG: hypothetical protein M0R17_05665 [Candidatus Omnitrophica bacterium]|jgi:hypothetical protein|nr:hypothetical protein [Candidatus Omnitrophota bacterium]
MTEIKTLKDLRKIKGYENGNINFLIPESQLKAEAVKHYKMLKEAGEWRTCSWVKQFFNLSEENLK